VTRRGTGATIVEEFHRRRFRLQFILLALVLVADPLLELLGIDGSVLERGLVLCVALALIGFERGQPPLVRGVILVLAAGALLTGIVGHELTRQDTWVWLIVGAVVVVATVRRSLSPGHADSERVFAALDGYLLAGLLFGACYWHLAARSPAAFVGGMPFASRLDAVYYSFGTLATLGYPGITPASSAARGLTVVEAVAGQLYLAVLLARLVSLYAPAARSK
jgi:voltage-gated potassium channel